MITQCVVCMKDCVIPENELESMMKGITKYWSYNDDKTIRPYCSPECSLKEYEEKRKHET